MPGFFKDWGFAEVLIAVLFGVIGAGWALWERYRNRKDLRYSLLYNASLVTVREEAKERIQILFDNQLIANARLAVIKLLNQGRIPITSSDFEEPITVSMGSNAEVLAADIVELEPEYLTPSVTVENNEIKIAPLLLNEGDSFTIRAIGSRFDDTIDLTSRITGVKEIRMIRAERFLFPYTLILLGALIVLGFVIVTLQQLRPANDFTYPIRVQERNTSQAIPDATISIEVAGRAPLSEQTDSNGLAIFVVPASYIGRAARLTVEVIGYKNYGQYIDLTEDILPSTIRLERTP